MKSIEIARYSLNKFPETKEESDAMGLSMVQHQVDTINKLMASSFEGMFSKPLAGIKLSDLKRIVTEGRTYLQYQDRTFLTLHDIKEEFDESGEDEHFLVFRQCYEVPTS